MAEATQVEGVFRPNLPEELIIMLLNEQTGYFHQVLGLGVELRRSRRRCSRNSPSVRASTPTWTR